MGSLANSEDFSDEKAGYGAVIIPGGNDCDSGTVDFFSYRDTFDIPLDDDSYDGSVDHELWVDRDEQSVLAEFARLGFTIHDYVRTRPLTDPLTD